MKVRRGRKPGRATAVNAPFHGLSRSVSARNGATIMLTLEDEKTGGFFQIEIGAEDARSAYFDSLIEYLTDLRDHVATESKAAS